MSDEKPNATEIESVSKLESESSTEREKIRAQDEHLRDLDQLLRDNPAGFIDNPIRSIEDHLFPHYVDPLWEKCNASGAGVVTKDELYRGARLAKIEHSLDLGKKTSMVITEPERKALRIQRSRAFWKEPKEMQITIFVCCLASMVQGWAQVANGNFGWPLDLYKEHERPYEYSKDHPLLFAAVQAVPWFSAAVLGSYLSDPLSEFFGRRKALFVAGCCSLVGSVAGSQAQTWQALLGSRVILGLGIGGKASIVPVMESEMLPPSKRGRVLVSWQAFTATGLFCGSIACYILREHWRGQYISGALPAVLLLATVFGSCESPRWLVIRGHYEKAYNSLVRLRGERVVAAKELVSIHYQIQAERRVYLERKIEDDPSKPNLTTYNSVLPRSSYWERLRNMFIFPRVRRAAIAASIVMLAQQLSGINILAFMATQFYYLVRTRDNDNLGEDDREKEEAKSFRFAIGFGLANMIFSIAAYYLVENRDPPKRDWEDMPSSNDQTESQPPIDVDPSMYNDKQRFRGRRFLLLTSLAAGVITLLLTSMMFKLDESRRTPLIIFFTIVFTVFYSPGAGAIPFLYCAEIFPNEGRELGMSWSTFCNFLGAGVLALAVPFGFAWGPEKLLGVFSACNAVAFVLVYFFVPGTNHTATLEDMNYVFAHKLRSHAREQKDILFGTFGRVSTSDEK